LSWTKTPLMSCAAAIAFLATAGVAAETIVVRSSGPSARAYPPGKSLPDSAKVALKAGDSVTILDGRGTRVLKGPGTFSTTAATATSTSINQVLRNTGARQVRTGAVRGVGSASAARPPSVWLVDATKSGTVCYAGTEAVSLWMPGQADAATVTVTRVADGKSVPLALRPGQTIKVWPAEELPVADGSEFRISGAGMASPVTLRFAALGPNPQGLESTASALITKGCNAQLDLLIETVAVPGGEDTPSG
jgi:hypothetical protein